MRCRHAIVQDVGLLYQRLGKYQRKRDRASRMMPRIEAEIGEAHRQQQRQQRLRTECVRPPINCAGPKCYACGIIFRILRSDPEGRSWERCWHCTCFRCGACRETPCECLRDMDTPRSPSPQPSPPPPPPPGASAGPADQSATEPAAAAAAAADADDTSGDV